MSARQSLDAAVRPDAGSAKAQTTLLRRLWQRPCAGSPACADRGAGVHDDWRARRSAPSPGWCVRSSMSCSRRFHGWRDLGREPDCCPVRHPVAVGLHAAADRGECRPSRSNALQGRLVNHMLGLDQRFFLDNAPGALIERVRGDTLALQKLASSTLITAGRDTVTLLSLIAVMLVTDWVMDAHGAVGIPLLVVPLALVQSYIRTTSAQIPRRRRAPVHPAGRDLSRHPDDQAQPAGTVRGQTLRAGADALPPPRDARAGGAGREPRH
jgi:hypothetical protein